MAQNVSDLNLLAKLQQILFRIDLDKVAECNMAKAPDESCKKVMKNLTGRDWLKWDAPDKVYLKSWRYEQNPVNNKGVVVQAPVLFAIFLLV